MADWFKWMGIKPSRGCKCDALKRAMNRKGWQWCEVNADWIIGKIRKNAKASDIVFSEIGARITLWAAIWEVKSAEKNLKAQNVS